MLAGAVHVRDVSHWSRLECAVDGSFAQLELWKDALTIVAQRDGYACSQQLTVFPGSSPLVLSLEPGGELSGSFSFRATADPAELTCVLVEQDARAAAPGTRIEVEDDGTFACRRLRPGRYSLLVAPADHLPPCLRIDELEVRAGEHLRDARLQQIDITSMLHDIRVQVLGPDGGRLGDAEITLIEHSAPPDTEPESHWTSSDGYANLWSTRPVVELVVVAENMRIEHVRRAHDGAIVRMRPKLRVLIQLAGTVEPSSWIELSARYESGLDARLVETLGADCSDFDLGETWLEGGAPMPFALGAAGRWRISGSVGSDDGTARLRFAGGAEEVLIEVLDDPELQRFVLELEPSTARPSADGD